MSRRRFISAADQPALPLDEVAAAQPTPARRPRARSRGPEDQPLQLLLDEDFEARAVAADPPPIDQARRPEPSPRLRMLKAELPDDKAEPPEIEAEPPGFHPDPFADIPGLGPSPSAGGEFVLLPGSLRGRLDLREFSRFLASLPTVVRDWDGSPEVDDGGIRLRGVDGGAWVYPEARRARLVTDGSTQGPLGEDLVALCRWLEARAGMRLYPEGESTATGADRSLDPWDTFLGR